MRPARARDQLGPLVGERLELAVAVELVAEEVAEHDQRGVELRRRPAAARPRRPRTGPRSPRCSSSAVATPQVMFEPARLWTGSRPSARRIAAIIPAVVVLPLVALTIVEPRSSRAPSRAIASGARRSRTRPGQGRAAAAAAARLAAPIARATRDAWRRTARRRARSGRSGAGRRRHDHAAARAAAPAARPAGR